MCLVGVDRVVFWCFDFYWVCYIECVLVFYYFGGCKLLCIFVIDIFSFEGLWLVCCVGFGRGR